MWLEALLLTITGLPFAAAIWLVLGFIVGWNRGEKGEKETAQVAITAHTLSLLGLIGLSLYAWRYTLNPHLVLWTWLESGRFSVKLSFELSGLSLSFALVIATINLLVARFSVNYLHRERGFQRFFIVLNLFTCGMLLIVLSGNAMIGFVGWEMAGISSYMLIAYAWHRDTAVEGATSAFVTNRFGDTGYLFSLFIAFTWLGSSEWSVLLERHINMPGLLLALMTLGFCLAALIKSAQFPFSAWITRALEGPTPSSAVFYGSIMVHAGIYLLLRMHPLIEQTPELQTLLRLVGLLTVLYGWLGAQVQTDIKSSLLFSTQQQTGLMVITISYGWYNLAAVHMLLHAIWRAYQFLHSPSFLQQTGWMPAKPVPYWLQRQQWLYAAALQRFWLVPLEHALLVRPTQALAQEAQLLDSHILDRLTGSPLSSTLPTTEPISIVGEGHGLLGRLMQWVAEGFQDLEDRLLLRKSGKRLNQSLGYLGSYLDFIEDLLKQPRYLILLIAATLAVIL